MLQAVFIDGIDAITVKGLYQWDKGQKLQITLSSLPAKFQVHFANKREETAYVVEGTASDGVGTVEIPNIILQKSIGAKAWIYVSEGDSGETIKAIDLPIVERAKPSDYIYSEIEILNYEKVIAEAESIVREVEAIKDHVETIAVNGSVIYQEVSGSPILITDGVNGKYRDFTAYGASEQKKYSGKNLANVKDKTSETRQGITSTIISEVVTASGTASGYNADIVVYLKTNLIFDANTDYVVSLQERTGTIPSSIVVYLYDALTSKYYAYKSLDAEYKAVFNLTESIECSNMLLRVTNNTTINGTFKVQIEKGSTKTDYEPYVGGVASPNPTYPQEILSNGHRGYFDGELLNGVYSNATGAFSSLAFYVCSKNPIPCKEGDKINVKYRAVANAISIVYYDKDMNQVNYVALANVSEIAPTAPANASYFHFSINENGLALTPQTAKHVCVTINGKYALIQKSVNKNFLPYPYTQASGTYKNVAVTINEDGSITFVGTASENLYFNLLLSTDNLLHFETEKIYTISGASDNVKLQVYDAKNSTWSSQKASTTSSANFQFDTEATGILVRIQILSGTTLNETIYPMIRPSGTDDTYVPHEHQTTYIPISEPLRGIGEVKDEIACVDGVYGVIRRIGKYVCDGSSDEGWRDSGSTAYPNSYLYTGLFNLLGAKRGVYDCMCDYFVHTQVAGTPVDTDTPHIRMADVATNPYIALWVSRDMFASVSDFTDWLAENHMTIIYNLEKETFTPFADQTPFYSMKTFDGVTLISSDAEMEIEYATDTKTYIDNKFAELQAALVNVL